MIQVLFFLDDDTNPNSTYFEDMLGTAVIVEDADGAGGGVVLQVTGTSFHNCVYDFSILDETTTGY